MDELTIDFGNPQSIADALPIIEQRLDLIKVERDAAVRDRDAAQERADKAENDARIWVAYYNVIEEHARTLGLLVPADNDAAKDGEIPDAVGSGDSKAAVFRILNSEPAAAMSIAEVARRVPDFERKTVAWALWKLSEEGLIQRLARGVYAPNSYKVQELTPRLNGAGRSSTQDAVQRDPAERTRTETPHGLGT